MHPGADEQRHDRHDGGAKPRGERDLRGLQPEAGANLSGRGVDEAHAVLVARAGGGEGGRCTRIECPLVASGLRRGKVSPLRGPWRFPPGRPWAAG